MKCAYSAGILDRFLDDKITFDYCIGVSAGAANTLSYLAGQRGRNLRFYTVHLDDPRYLSVRSLLRTGNLFGLEYIYGTLTNSDGADPIDYDAIMKNPANFICRQRMPSQKGSLFFQVRHRARRLPHHHGDLRASCVLPPGQCERTFLLRRRCCRFYPGTPCLRTRLRQGCHHPVKSARFREAAGGTPADLQAHAAQISQDHRRDRPPPYQLSGFD